ncbi:hypothetical protein D3C86_1337400 [compost metagenome]
MPRRIEQRLDLGTYALEVRRQRKHFQLGDRMSGGGPNGGLVIRRGLQPIQPLGDPDQLRRAQIGFRIVVCASPQKGDSGLQHPVEILYVFRADRAHNALVEEGKGTACGAGDRPSASRMHTIARAEPGPLPQLPLRKTLALSRD